MTVEFAFGPAGSQSWYMESPSEWRMNNLPSELQAMFTAPTDVAYAHSLVLGANGSFMLAYKKRTKNCSSIFQKGIPEQLRVWLTEEDSKGYLVRDLPNLQVALGPDNNSYFATDGKRTCWHNLPASLDKAIDDLRNPNGSFHTNPRVVALGLDENYIMISDKNGGSWQLSKYPNLEKHINTFIAAAGGRGGALKPILYVWLDPHDATDVHWVLMNTSNDLEGEVLDEAASDAQAIMESTSAIATQAAPTALQNTGRKHSSGLGTSLLKAVVGGIAKGMNNSASGGGSGVGGVDTSSFVDFGSNNNGGSSSGFWDPIQSAASNPIL